MEAVMELGRTEKIISWTCQLGAAGILGQTLFFKFTGAPESVYIFSAIGMEPWGRIGSGAMELVAVFLLLYPRTPVLGAVLAIGLMAGAIFFHLTKLGIEVQGDGGLLFKLALAVVLCSAVVLVLRRREIPILGGRL
jgi:putative oxidoreductase